MVGVDKVVQRSNEEREPRLLTAQSVVANAHRVSLDVAVDGCVRDNYGPDEDADKVEVEVEDEPRQVCGTAICAIGPPNLCTPRNHNLAGCDSARESAICHMPIRTPNLTIFAKIPCTAEKASIQTHRPFPLTSTERALQLRRRQ